MFIYPFEDILKKKKKKKSVNVSIYREAKNLDVHVERLNRMFKETKRHQQLQRIRGIPSDILEMMGLYHIESL